MLEEGQTDKRRGRMHKLKHTTEEKESMIMCLDKSSSERYRGLDIPQNICVGPSSVSDPTLQLIRKIILLEHHNLPKMNG